MELLTAKVLCAIVFYWKGTHRNLDYVFRIEMRILYLSIGKIAVGYRNTKIFASIKNFKIDSTQDFWDDLSNHQKEEIEKASLEIDHGNVTDYESFMKKHL